MALFSTQIATKHMVPVCRQLATAYSAGISIISSMDHVGTQVKNAKVRRVFTDMGDDLRKGSTLGEAAQAQSKYLSPFFIQLLTSGEQGGRLDVMLRDLAQYFEDRLAMARQIKGTLTLPAIQLVMAWYLGSFAMGIIGVVLAGAEGAGGGINGVIAYFYDYLWFQAKVMAVALFLGAIAVVLARQGLLAWMTGAISTHIWPLSNVTRKFGLARFFRSLSLLIGSGLSITRCIESAAAVTANPYMERDLLQAVPHVKEGRTLSEAFSHSRYMTPMAREMLFVGEQSGNLEGQLKKVSEYHLQEATHAVAVATRIMSVAIVLGVGLLIGYLVISFYTKLYGGLLDELGI